MSIFQTVTSLCWRSCSYLHTLFSGAAPRECRFIHAPFVDVNIPLQVYADYVCRQAGLLELRCHRLPSSHVRSCVVQVLWSRGSLEYLAFLRRLV